MKINYYAQAIDIILLQTIEYKKIVGEIIKSNPAVFVKACRKIYPLETNENKEYIELLREGKKIQAIKLYRDKTGLSLRECKDFIDGLQFTFGIFY